MTMSVSDLPFDLVKQLRLAVERATLVHGDGTPYGADNAADDVCALVRNYLATNPPYRPPEDTKDWLLQEEDVAVASDVTGLSPAIIRTAVRAYYTAVFDDES